MTVKWIVDEKLNALREQIEQEDGFWAEVQILNFTESVFEQMQRRGISQAELARRLGKSEAYVSKILRGTANFTLKSMDKIARALECSFDPTLRPKQKQPAKKA